MVNQNMKRKSEDMHEEQSEKRPHQDLEFTCSEVRAESTIIGGMEDSANDDEFLEEDGFDNDDSIGEGDSNLVETLVSSVNER